MKKTIIFLALAMCSALIASACGGTSTNVNVNANRTAANSNYNSAANNSNGSTLGNAANTVSNTISNMTTSGPDSFLKDAAQGGLAEVEIGKLASTKAKDAEVKRFAQMMVTDHTKANNELKELAAKKNIQLPTDIGSHKSLLDELNGLSGDEFDKEYVEEMVNDHEDDVSAFEKQASSASDPDVKAFAAKTLPVLKKHLEAIKAIQAKMKK